MRWEEALCLTSQKRYIYPVLFRSIRRLTWTQELVAIAETEIRQIEAWQVDFTEVAIPTPVGGWEKNRVESGNSAEQTRAYERFSAQKDAQAAAMVVVKDLHLASNAENAVSGV